jgi:prephenate dehydrogenase
MTQVDSQLNQFDQVIVVGTGLLGGSIGLGLKAVGFGGRIVGVGRRAVTVQRAIELGCIDQAKTDLRAAVSTGDRMLVILATPLGTFESLFEQLAGVGRADLTITDVGSTKAHVCATAKRLLPDPRRFVGSHPMAGGEQHGPQFAEANLFRDRPCIICVDEDTDVEAQQTVESLWTTLGMRLIRMSATEHDRQTSIISHLPHATAALLVTLAAHKGGLEIASSGFGDTTRVASGDPQVWVDIFTTNRGAMLDAIDGLSGELAHLRKMIADDDRDALLELLAHGKETRDAWIAAQGS